MKHNPATIKLLLAILLLLFSSDLAMAENLPIINGKEVVATVGEEVITKDEFNQALSMLHANMNEAQKAGAVTYSSLLQRLVVTRLILLEARDIGLDKLPEVEKLVKDYSEESLREFYLRQQVGEVEPDAKVVDELYKKEVREWMISSVLIENEDKAREVRANIKSRADLDRVTRELIADGEATGGKEETFLGKSNLPSPITQALSKMKVGDVSPVIPVGNGFVILSLLDIRYPEDPKAREMAEKTAKQKEIRATLDAYYETLKEEHAVIDEKLLESLDFEAADPGLEALATDARVIATIDGDQKVTVGMVVAALKDKYFHGIERAIQEKKLNSSARTLFEKMVIENIIDRQARALKLDTSEKFTAMVREYENSVVFSAFIKKVVSPDIKLTEEQLEQHYQEHIASYSFPEMITLESLAFTRLDSAQDALKKLNDGVDFAWMKANADGQTDRDANELREYDNKPLTTRSLGKDLQQALDKAPAGSFRLYSSPKDIHYVLHVQKLIPASPKPFDQVKEELARVMRNLEIKQAVVDLADKLSKVHEVKIYAKDGEMPKAG